MHPKQPRPLDAARLWDYALKSLAGRAHSTGELREKLRRRAERAADVDDVLGRLKEHGYLDDRRFAEGFAAARLSTEKFGRSRVLQDLRQRRVAPALAERTVRQVYEDVNEAALIEDWIRRKYGPKVGHTLACPPFQSDKEVAAAYRRLLRAGFRTGDILRVLKRFAKNPELLDSFEPPEEAPEE